MTSITATARALPETGVDRAIRGLARALEAFVHARMGRRARAVARTRARLHGADARRAAEAHGAFGVLPR